MEQLKSLKNQLLIAMPNLADPYFSQSVVYIYEHSDSGAVGFVINKPTRITVGDILKRVNIPVTHEGVSELPTLLGGPVSQEQVFMIQRDISPGGEAETQDLHYTISKEVLKALAQGDKRADTIVFFGYSEWDVGQLENEISSNYWLLAPVNLDLLFDVPFDRRYQTAGALLGIDINNLSDETGHA